MKLELITFENYKEAIAIQKRIFPNEDGTINLLASLDRDLFMERTGLFYIDDNVKYYIAKYEGQSVGITGTYDYQNKDEVWLAWFGVLDEFRNKGLGEKLLKKTIELVKNNGFKTMRLYADKLDNANAIKLYEKIGFIGEKYLAEELNYDCWIYSKSLTDAKVVMWNNKNLNLSYQSELDQMDNNKVAKILQMYDNEFMNK